MPFLAKICIIAFTCMMFRCPVVAQQASARLATCAKQSMGCSGLWKSKSWDRVIKQRKQGYLSLGVTYDKVMTGTHLGTNVFQKQYRIGLPLMAGYQVNNWTIEGGAFVGGFMARELNSPWFGELANDRQSELRRIAPQAGILLATNLQVTQFGQLSFRFFPWQTKVDDNQFADIQMGWRWTF